MQRVDFETFIVEDAILEDYLFIFPHGRLNKIFVNSVSTRSITTPMLRKLYKLAGFVLEKNLKHIL